MNKQGFEIITKIIAENIRDKHPNATEKQIMNWTKYAMRRLKIPVNNKRPDIAGQMIMTI